MRVSSKLMGWKHQIDGIKNCKDDIKARQICQEIGTVIILCGFVIVLPYFVEQKRESMLSSDLENLQEWNFLF